MFALNLEHLCIADVPATPEGHSRTSLAPGHFCVCTFSLCMCGVSPPLKTNVHVNADVDLLLQSVWVCRSERVWGCWHVQDVYLPFSDHCHPGRQQQQRDGQMEGWMDMTPAALVWQWNWADTSLPLKVTWASAWRPNSCVCISSVNRVVQVSQLYFSFCSVITQTGRSVSRPDVCTTTGTRS